MRKLAFIVLTASIWIAGIGEASAQAYVTAFKTGERITGNTKQCYYEFGGNEYTRTVRSHELCPYSIRVRL